MRYGSMFGPNITFLGIPECDVNEVNSYKDADVVIIVHPLTVEQVIDPVTDLDLLQLEAQIIYLTMVLVPI